MGRDSSGIQLVIMKLRWLIPFLVCLPLGAQTFFSNTASSATAVSVNITIPAGCPTAPTGCSVIAFFGAPLAGTSPIVAFTGSGACPSTFPIQTPAAFEEFWWSYALNLSAGSCTVTATITNSAFTGSLDIVAVVKTGLTQFAAYETQSYTNGSSVTSLTNSFITQGSSDYIVSGSFLDGCGTTVSSGSGYNFRGFVQTPSPPGLGGIGVLDLNSAAAGNQSNQVNFGCSVTHGEQILLAFRTALPTSGLRQVAHLTFTTVNSTSGSLPAPILAGSTVVAEVASGSAVAVQPISDDTSDNCAFAVGPTYWAFSNNQRLSYACVNVTAGTRTFTIPFSGTASGEVFLYEVAGVSTTQPIWMALLGDSSRGVTTNIQVHSISLPAGTYTIVGAIDDLSCTSLGGNFYNPPQSGYTDFYDTPIGSGSGCPILKSVVSENITNPGTVGYSTTPSSGTADVSANMSWIAFSAATNTNPRPTDIGQQGTTQYPIQAGDNRILCGAFTTGYTGAPTSTLTSHGWAAIDGFYTITSGSINGSNVATFQAANNAIAGGQVTLQTFPTSTYLNGLTVTVLAAGLSSTQFEANVTHAAATIEAGQAIAPIACWWNYYTGSGYDTVTVAGVGADNPIIEFGFRGYQNAIITNWRNCGASVTSCADGGITTTVAGSVVQATGLAYTTRTTQPVSTTSGFTQNVSIFGHTEGFGSAFQLNASAATYQDTWTFTSAQGMSAAIFAFAPLISTTKQPVVNVITEKGKRFGSDPWVVIVDLITQNADPTQAWRKEISR